jgi:fibronectin-binding autotransporter adhesin
VQNNTVTLAASATPVISVGSGLSATVNWAVAGTQGFEKTGAGILVLDGDQGGMTVAGITVSAGTLRAGASDKNFIPGVGTLTIAPAAVVDLNGFGEGINGLAGSSTVTTDAATANVRFGVGDGNASSTFDGLIENGAGSIYLQKNGTGTLTLTNTSNSFSGTVIDSSNNRALPTTIHLASGKLAFTSNGALGVAGGDLYLDEGSFATDALVFGGDGITLDGGRTFNVNYFTSIEVGSGRTGTVAGPIWGDDNDGAAVGGNDSIQKTGTGTLILSGGTDQIDEVFVAKGTLLAQSTIDTARVTVSAGATLGGTGTITGDTVGNGTHSTGSSAAVGSVGDLTFSGAATDLSFSSGSFWLVDLVQGALDNADTVLVGGTLSLGNSVFDPTFLMTGTYTLGTRYTLAIYCGLSGSFSSFADNMVYTLGGAGGGDYLFLYNDVGAITLTAVPEPGSLLILGAAGGLLYWRRRSRRATPQ